MINVGIIGATGYTGAELLRLLVQHPDARIQVVTSRSEAGSAVADLFPNLRGRLALDFRVPDTQALRECDLVFFATPNGTAMTMVPELLAGATKVIDLAADFRLRSAAQWKQWYGVEHACPELLRDAVYGLPELNREAIRGASLVANPGCYPTAVILGLLPLVEQGLVDTGHIIADAKSGVSGAGRNARLGNLFGEASDNFKAYGVAGHRHLPEIKQVLHDASGDHVDLTFVPHLTPMIRGIHATLYGQMGKPFAEIKQAFTARYQTEPFVDVISHDDAHPDTRSVRGSNYCRIALHQAPGNDMLVVLSVIDNLVKGAAGQAVQNMNLMYGFDERAGLEGIALLP